jgi:glucokinase
MAYFLSGDIGGTKTLLQLCEAGSPQPLLKKSFSSSGHAGLEEMVEILLAEASQREIQGAAFALAGPVAGRVVQLTNLPWAVDGDALAARFSIPAVTLLNDFEAAGYGIEALQPEDLLSLQEGVPQAGGVRLVVGAGTGLGVAWLTWQGEHYRVNSSEAGHMDFAPNDDMQAMLLRYLQKRHGHVSYERIVSGQGLLAIFDFMRESGVAVPTSRMQAAMQEEDPAAVISRYAFHEDEPIAKLVMDVFFATYGAFVGNLALAALPRGGIYVAGGIAAKLQQQFAHTPFLQAMQDKGRFSKLMSSLPVQLVLNENLGLMGAGLIASRL